MARSASAANCIIDFEIAHLQKLNLFLKARCARALRAITHPGSLGLLRLPGTDEWVLYLSAHFRKPVA